MICELARKPHRIAPRAMPIGWLRPSSATAMPVKPMPPKPSVYVWLSPSMRGRLTRPATAPEISIAVITMRLALTPLATAAKGL